MTRIAAHVSVEALRDRYVSSADVVEARHFQTIWLLAKGHGVGDVAEMTSFGQRWIEQLVVRYNAEGPDALGDLRRRNGSTARVLTPEGLQAAGSLARSARRRRSVDERQGRFISRARTGVGKGRRATRLGGAEGLRHVDPDAAPEKSQVRHAGRHGGVLKKPRRHRCRGSGKASRATGRGLCERRTSARPEAGGAPPIRTRPCCPPRSATNARPYSSRVRKRPRV